MSTSPLSAPERPEPAARRGLSTPAAVALQGVAVLGVLLAAGALAGLLWFRLWDPPAGAVQSGTWLTDETGLRADFSGTGLYVVVATLTGLVLGAVVGLLLARSELVTLGLLLVGATLAGWVMYRVGVLDSPADPRVLAAGAADGTVLPGRLHVSGWSPFVAMPTGALLGYAVLLVALPGRGPGHSERDS